MTKVRLTKSILTKVIEIPGIEGSQVKIKHSIMLSDLTDDLARGEQKDQAAKMLTKLISSWNFVDEEDKDVPITAEVIQEYFTTAQVEFVLNEVAEFAKSAKKS